MRLTEKNMDRLRIEGEMEGIKEALKDIKEGLWNNPLDEDLLKIRSKLMKEYRRLERIYKKKVTE